MDYTDWRICAVCKQTDIVWKEGNFVLFHYLMRHYAHAPCMVAKWGLAESLARIKHDWRIKLFKKALKAVKPKKATVTK